MAIPVLEAVNGVGSDCFDVVTREELAREVRNARPRIQIENAVANGLNEVGLARAGRPVDEERVVDSPRRLDCRDGGGMGQPIARADHETIKRVLGVQAEQRLVGRGLNIMKRLPAIAVRKSDAHQPPGRRLGSIDKCRPAIAFEIDGLIVIGGLDNEFAAVEPADAQLGKPVSNESRVAIFDILKDTIRIQTLGRSHSVTKSQAVRRRVHTDGGPPEISTNVMFHRK